MVHLFLFLISFSAFADPTPAPVSGSPLDLDTVCREQAPSQPLIIIDDGFCEVWLETRAKISAESILPVTGKLNAVPACAEAIPSPSPVKSTGDKWKVRLYASHSSTTYFSSDLKIDSSRYQVSIQDYEWAERSSREFFLPETWAKEGNNPLQMIDEPTNTFTVSIEKNGTEFFLSAFHPKYLQKDGQIKQMTGTIDGVAIDRMQAVNTPFYGYMHTPGESKIIQNRCTHKQMEFTVGVGKRFTLAKGQAGSLVYTPSIATGVMAGACVTQAVKQGEWWEFDGTTDRMQIQGFGGNVTNRLEFNSPNERFGLFYENKLGLYHMKHGFLDGTQEYNLGFMGNSVGMKFMIHNPARKRAPSSTP
jgi:hypothetical protein